MTEPKRFAVPLDQLDDVRVEEAQQVQEVPASDAAAEGVHPYGDGMADADGD